MHAIASALLSTAWQHFNRMIWIIGEHLWRNIEWRLVTL
jgi:hypothetical protein